MAEAWKELAAAASLEKDPEKLRILMNKLIDTFGQEQKRVRDEIDRRIRGVEFVERVHVEDSD